LAVQSANGPATEQCIDILKSRIRILESLLERCRQEHGGLGDDAASELNPLVGDDKDDDEPPGTSDDDDDNSERLKVLFVIKFFVAKLSLLNHFSTSSRTKIFNITAQHPLFNMHPKSQSAVLVFRKS
jgi:hypothetical protein